MNFLRRLRALFRREKLDAEMTAEMQFHLETQTEVNLRAGMTPADARLAARRQFGGVDQIQE
jgi:putative ABC transport system permease protein